MSKRPMGHGDIRQMGNFKAVAADYAYYLTLGDEGRLYCLTDRQVYILLVQCEYIGWLTRWYNTDDINQTVVQFIQAEVMEALMSCVDISILVDQGKLTLTRSVQQQQIQSQTLRDEYADEYDGSPTSINPDAPTTNFGSTGDRYDALCAALMAFVYQFAKGQIEAIVAGDVAAFALLGLAAALLIPGLNLFFIAGAAIALIAGGGIIGVTTAVACEALGDKVALDAVVCYMRDQLKDLSVTEANWSSVLDSYPFSVGSHEAIICDFIKPTLADNYLPVLDMLGQAYSGTINGEPLPDCPCESATVILINGFPAVFPTTVITWISKDGPWDVYDITSTQFDPPWGAFTGSNSVTYHDGFNVAADGSVPFLAEDVSGLDWQQSSLAAGGLQQGAHFDGVTPYLQLGGFTTSIPRTVRVRVKFP